MNNFEDQTQFAQEEPTLEAVHTPVAPVVKKNPELPIDPENMTEEELLAAAKVEKAKKNKKMLILGGIIFAIVMLGSILLIALMPQMSEPDVIDTNLQVQKPVTEQTKIERDVAELKDRLKQIDPTIEYSTVPPVNYEISLD